MFGVGLISSLLGNEGGLTGVDLGKWGA